MNILSMILQDPVCYTPMAFLDQGLIYVSTCMLLLTGDALAARTTGSNGQIQKGNVRTGLFLASERVCVPLYVVIMSSNSPRIKKGDM